eukprot:scaffold2926_cov247-Pinguiococcus_pyrenoidosus.AAC.10
MISATRSRRTMYVMRIARGLSPTQSRTGVSRTDIVVVRSGGRFAASPREVLAAPKHPERLSGGVVRAACDGHRAGFWRDGAPAEHQNQGAPAFSSQREFRFRRREGGGCGCVQWEQLRSGDAHERGQGQRGAEHHHAEQQEERPATDLLGRQLAGARPQEAAAGRLAHGRAVLHGPPFRDAHAAVGDQSEDQPEPWAQPSEDSRAQSGHQQPHVEAQAQAKRRVETVAGERKTFALYSRDLRASTGILFFRG